MAEETVCYHRNVTDRVKYAIDDPPSMWVCLDCGDEFPLMGDTDQWKPREVERDEDGWTIKK